MCCENRCARGAGGCTIEEVGSDDDDRREVSTTPSAARAADADGGNPWPGILARAVPLPPHMAPQAVGVPYRVGGDDDDDTPAAAGTLGVVKTVLVCGAQPPSVPPVMSRAYVLMEVALPDGTVVFSSLDEEVEFVIGRGTWARVTRVEDDARTLHSTHAFVLCALFD